MSAQPCGPYILAGVGFQQPGCGAGASRRCSCRHGPPWQTQGRIGFRPVREQAATIAWRTRLQPRHRDDSSGPMDLSVCARTHQAAGSCRPRSRPFDIGRQSEAPYTAARSAKRPEPSPRQGCDTCRARPLPPGTSAGMPAHRRENGRARSNKKSENRIVTGPHTDRTDIPPIGSCGWRKCRRYRLRRTADRRILPAALRLPPKRIADRIRCCRGR